MSKRVIRTDQGAPPLGAYSQSWRAGDFVFVTGTGPIGPDGKVKGDTIEEQTAVTLDNIASVLEVEGAGLADVIKVTVHLSDTNRADVRRTVELAVERFGRLDALVGGASSTST
jgi:2-iminobutanoate/2-iminopropanoate deaminase